MRRYRFVTSTVNDDCVFFGYADLTSSTQLFDIVDFRSKPKFFRDHLATSQGSDVLQALLYDDHRIQEL